MADDPPPLTRRSRPGDRAAEISDNEGERMGQLEGKVALVTGAASGTGLATARRLTDEGARLCCVDIDPRGQAVADAVDGVFVRADAGDSTDVDQAFQACELEL